MDVSKIDFFVAIARAAQGGTESAPVPSGLGMNRVACGSDDKVVSVDSARRNTHTQERAGVSNARERTRTSTGFYSHQHLKLTRLPIPPLALRVMRNCIRDK